MNNGKTLRRLYWRTVRRIARRAGENKVWWLRAGVSHA